MALHLNPSHKLRARGRYPSGLDTKTNAIIGPKMRQKVKPRVTDCKGTSSGQSGEG